MKSSSAARVARETTDQHRASFHGPHRPYHRLAAPRVRIPEPEQTPMSNLYRAVFPCGLDMKSEKS